jgi:hypothetical protein
MSPRTCRYVRGPDGTLKTLSVHFALLKGVAKRRRLPSGSRGEAISDVESVLMLKPAMNKDLPTNYQAALTAARARLAGADILLQAGRLGGSLETGRGGARAVTLPCMGATYRIHLPGGAVSRDDGGPVSVFAEILILHALIGHTGRPVTGEWIGFSDIPDGLLYASVYEKRTARRLARALSGGGSGLWPAAGRLGGHDEALGGNVSAVVEPFFGVPVGIVFWEPDDQFDEAVTFLYDRTITEILATEDIVVLTQWVVEEMIHILSEAAA